MKVRVEYNSQTEPGMDPESVYDSVEFTTYHAGDIENWGEAVLDFVRPAAYQGHAIIIEALHLSSEGDDLNPFFAKKHRQKVVDLIEWLWAGLAEADESQDPAIQHLRKTLQEGE